MSLKIIEGKLDNLEDKYFSGAVNQESYDKWRIRYENERYVVLNLLDSLKSPQSQEWAKYSKHIDKLKDINYLYNTADVLGKKHFIGMVFNNKLYYQDGSYRTPYLLSQFLSKAAPLKEKGLLLVEQPSVFLSKTALSAPDGNNIEHLIKLLVWIDSLKAA